MGSTSIPENYVPILLFISVALVVGAFALLAGTLARPNRPYRAKLTPYESGSPLFSDARIQFPMRYYIIAMLFVDRGHLHDPLGHSVSVARPAGPHRDARVHHHPPGWVLVRLEEGGVRMGLKDCKALGVKRKGSSISPYALRLTPDARQQ
jgi:hypothetical protein